MEKEHEETNGTQRKRRVTVHGVLACFHLAGSDKTALEELRRLAPGRRVLRHALEILQARERPTSVLETYMRETGVSTDISPTIGRTKPVLGDKREYSVQELKNGTRYIRLPVNHLGLRPKEIVIARFDRATITVERAVA